MIARTIGSSESEEDFHNTIARLILLSYVISYTGSLSLVG